MSASDELAHQQRGAGVKNDSSLEFNELQQSERLKFVNHLRRDLGCVGEQSIRARIADLRSNLESLYRLAEMTNQPERQPLKEIRSGLRREIDLMGNGQVIDENRQR